MLEPDDFRRVTDTWQAHYLERTGKKPSWKAMGKRAFGDLRRLTVALGADELCERIRVLFHEPPKFLAGSTPDIATLAQHIEKLAAPATSARASPRNVATTGDELRALRDEMRKAGVP